MRRGFKVTAVPGPACIRKGYAVAQVIEALRHNRKFVGSIPDDVIGIFH